MKKTILQKVKKEVNNSSEAEKMWQRALKGYLKDKISLTDTVEVGGYLKDKYKIKLFA